MWPVTLISATGDGWLFWRLLPELLPCCPENAVQTALVVRSAFRLASYRMGVWMFSCRMSSRTGAARNQRFQGSDGSSPGGLQGDPERRAAEAA